MTERSRVENELAVENSMQPRILQEFSANMCFGGFAPSWLDVSSEIRT